MMSLSGVCLVWDPISEMNFFHPSSDAAPTPSARLTEVAVKNDAVSVVMPVAPPEPEPAAVPSDATSGTGTLVAMLL